MKIPLIFFTVTVLTCSAVPAQPVKLQEGSKIGLINLVSDETKNAYWALTVFNNFEETKAVDWGIRGYINEGIKTRIESGSNYHVIVINDEAVNTSCPSQLTNYFGQITKQTKKCLSELKNEYGIEILIYVAESSGYIAGTRYTKGYGVHGVRNEGFIHANITMYSVSLEKFYIFFPTIMDEISRKTKRPRSSKPVPLLRYIDKEEKLFTVNERVQRIVTGLIDNYLDWYFSRIPIDPPLRRELSSQ